VTSRSSREKHGTGNTATFAASAIPCSRQSGLVVATLIPSETIAPRPLDVSNSKEHGARIPSRLRCRSTVKEVLVTIRELAEQGMICSFVTHEVGFAREVVDEIDLAGHRVIVEHGPSATFFTEARDERTRRFLSQVP
jgi:hypothetical protein